MTKELMTLQQVYDKVRKHLLEQNAQSKAVLSKIYPSDLACAYRGENGMRCAIGCLINDTDYHERMEGLGVISVWNEIESSTGLKSTNNEAYALLSDLQVCHDAFHPDSWRAKLDMIAKTHGLTT